MCYKWTVCSWSSCVPMDRSSPKRGSSVHAVKLDWIPQKSFCNRKQSLLRKGLRRCRPVGVPILTPVHHRESLQGSKLEHRAKKVVQSYEGHRPEWQWSLPAHMAKYISGTNVTFKALNSSDIATSKYLWDVQDKVVRQVHIFRDQGQGCSDVGRQTREVVLTSWLISVCP